MTMQTNLSQQRSVVAYDIASRCFVVVCHVSSSCLISSSHALHPFTPALSLQSPAFFLVFVHTNLLRERHRPSVLLRLILARALFPIPPLPHTTHISLSVAVLYVPPTPSFSGDASANVWCFVVISLYHSHAPLFSRFFSSFFTRCLERRLGIFPTATKELSSIIRSRNR